MINAWAMWLNDHAEAVVVVLAATAFVVECVGRTIRRSGDGAATAKPHWLRAWFVNCALLGCAFLTSWALATSLEPAFNQALGSETGLLVWLKLSASSYVTYVLLGVLLLDLVNYALHRLMHAVPLLWRLHQVHHSDVVMNASTHFRQHPLQLVAALLLQLPLLWLLGISGVSWVLYAAASVSVQLWQHADLAHSPQLERWLRWALVTPAMHRVHHDQRREFHDANYGSLFPVWDRLLGTYAAALPHVQLGLRRQDGESQTSPSSFTDCLWMPFQSLPKPAAKAELPKFKTNLQGKK